MLTAGWLKKKTFELTLSCCGIKVLLLLMLGGGVSVSLGWLLPAHIHLLHLSPLLCQLILFQCSLFLSFHHFYSFSVVPFFLPPFDTFPVILPPFVMFPHPLRCILSFACSSSPFHSEPAHTCFFSLLCLLLSPPPPPILHSHFGCIAGAG